MSLPAIMLGSHQLGGIASYLEPLIVRQPGPGVTSIAIQHDVMRLTYIGNPFSFRHVLLILLTIIVIFFSIRYLLFSFL